MFRYDPGAKQSERMPRGDLERVQRQQSALRRRHFQVEHDSSAGRHARRRRAAVLVGDDQLVPRDLGVVLERDAKARGLAGEHRLARGGADLHAGEIAVAVVHRRQRQRAEHECQAEREIVRVVHRAEEHREQHQRERDAERARHDVDAPGREGQGIGIDAVPLACPGAGLASQGGERALEHGAVSTSSRWLQGTATALSTSSPISCGFASSLRGLRRWPITAPSTACTSSGVTPGCE